MLEVGSVCPCCKDKHLNNNKEPLVLREVPKHRTTKQDLPVVYCVLCDSGDRGDGVHEQILRRSKS